MVIYLPFKGIFLRKLILKYVIIVESFETDPLITKYLKNPELQIKDMANNIKNKVNECIEYIDSIIKDHPVRNQLKPDKSQ